MGEGATFWSVVIGVVVSAAVGLTSLAIQTAMVEEVNRKLPEDRRFEGIWWDPGKTMRLFSEYRRLCPGGPLLRRQLTILGIVAVIFAIIVGWSSVR